MGTIGYAWAAARSPSSLSARPRRRVCAGVALCAMLVIAELITAGAFPAQAPAADLLTRMAVEQAD